jgi:hypothetical protein
MTFLLIYISISAYAAMYKFLTDLEAKRNMEHSSVAARSLATVVMVAVVPFFVVLRGCLVIYTKSYSLFTRSKKGSKNAQ